MRYFLLSFLVVVLVGADVSPAFAQDVAKDVESEFNVFKKKVAAAKESSVDGQKDAAPGGSASSDSPLGPAAHLPVNARLPATSYAMSGQTPEELQAAIDAEEETQRKKTDENNFNEALRLLLPLRPEQIRKVLENFKESRQAAETPIADPVPRTRVETISLDPSVPPASIKTSPGRVTTLTILDSTGSPWPIQDVSWAGKFDIAGPEEGGHVIRITPQTAHGVGNMSIRLVDLATPITFTLQTGLDEVYYRFDARIPKQGPLAKVPLIAYGGLKTVVGTDENLVQVLDGTPPSHSEKLKVDGTDGRTSVWRISGRIYLRTPLTLLSPSWDSSVTSADGMNVYTLSDAPVVLLSDGGKVVRINIAADEVTP
ncbi:MAG: type IV secretion protein DotH [Proteobacteria bacterium]|nr:type IV secretion protein DotH [Pseudomonadota bacterium]